MSWLILGSLAGGIIGWMLITIGNAGSSITSVTCTLIGYIICAISIIVFFSSWIGEAMTPFF